MIMRNAGLVLIVLSAAVFFLPGVSSQEKTESNLSESKTAETQVEEAVSIRAKERGFPFINFSDGKDLSLPNGTQHTGTAGRLLASADFDSDGIPDLITADTSGTLKFYAGNVASIYPNSMEANEQRQFGNYTDEAFLPNKKSFQLSFVPDFFAAGDFNTDGFQDILAAAKNDKILHLLTGDGAGNFAADFQINVEGAITAFATGEIGRRDGQTDLVVAVAGKKGAQLLVFEHPEGAFKHKPEIIKLSAPADSLTIGNLDEDFFADIATASGNKLTVVHGRGQAYPWDLLKEYDIKRPAAKTETRVLPFEIAALIAGNFTDRRGDSLAILTTNGSLQTLELPKNEKRNSQTRTLLADNLFVPSDVDASGFAVVKNNRTNSSKKPEESGAFPLNEEDREKFFDEQKTKTAAQMQEIGKEEKDKMTAEKSRLNNESRVRAKAEFLKAISPLPSVSLDKWNLQNLISDARLANAAFSPNATKLQRVRVSESGRDELVLLDTNAKQIHLLTQKSRYNDKTADLISFDSETRPNAVLPMRLNADALSDLVVLRENSAAPTIVMTAPVNTFVVDSNADDGNGITLRNAIIEANQNPGPDFITFAVSGPILPLTELPDIVGTVTIDGTSQGKVELSGSGIFEDPHVDGLQIRSANSVVRGMVINEFKSEFNPDIGRFEGGNGISVFNFVNQTVASYNIIEGNYLGTDRNGTIDKGNDATGVNIFDSDFNTIGGTTAAARNVMSGSGSNGSQNGPQRIGVGLSITDGKNSFIKGNYIGTNAAGTQKINNSYGVFFGASNSEFGGDEAGAGNVVSGNGDSYPTEFDPDRCGGAGVAEQTILEGGTNELLTFNNSFKGNRIGTNAAGTAALRNCNTGLITKPTHTSTVGSITENGRNTISGNQEGGLHCSNILRGFEFTESGNGQIELPVGFCYIVGNNIGTDVTGSISIPNEDLHGPSFVFYFGMLAIFNPESFSTVGAPGGTSPNECKGFCNLVSGNTEYQAIVRASDEGLVGVFNNYVGTNKGGSAALPNSQGVGVISNGATLVGAIGFDEDTNDEFSLGNLISGNSFEAVYLDGDFSALQGNLIGTDKTGLNAVPNTSDPENSSASAVSVGNGIVGGSHPLARNVIAGNGGGGISTLGASFIINNYIGVNSQRQPLGNAGDGIAINSSFVTVGNVPEAGNVIAHNGRSGVYVRNIVNFNGTVIPLKYNLIRLNSIFGNGALGIDLTADTTLPVEPDGITANDCLDVDDLANNLQNFPVLAAPVFNANGTVSVQGALQSEIRQSYVIDFYASAAGDPSNYGEGETFIGTQLIETNSNGQAAFGFNSTATVAPGSKITATASDLYGNTSEFSCVAGVCTGGTGGVSERRLSERELLDLLAPTCLTPIVVNVSDDRPDMTPDNGVCDVDLTMPDTQCSLRGAIETANANIGFDLISFNIPGGGVQIITPTSQTPPISDRVVIDATSQPGYTNSPLIELNGSSAPGAYGLALGDGSDGSAILGFAVNRFFGGISIGSGNNRVERCYIGLNANGAPAGTRTQQQIGVDIRYATGLNNRIGGSLSANAQNIISNNNIGVGISEGATGNRISGNFIGTNPNGTAAIANTIGISVENANGNIIGGNADDIGGNLISGNANYGVMLRTNSSENRVANNIIGADVSREEVLPNGVAGIYISENAGRNTISNNVIGGHNLEEGSSGIAIDFNAAPENRVEGNLIGISEPSPSGISIPNKYGIVVRADGQIIGSQNGANIIVRSEKAGIFLIAAAESSNPSVENNILQYNLVGTNGTDPLPNDEIGILLAGNVRNNVLDRNVVSGNEIFGIAVTDGASENRIVTNFIGTNTSVTSAIPNGGGIWIRQADDNTIESNVVSGNDIGIFVGTNFGLPPNSPVQKLSEFVVKFNDEESRKNLGSAYTTGNQIFGNVVGLNAFRNAAIPNSFGIIIGENARNNYIGSASGNYNLVSGNTATVGYGIFVGTLAENPPEDILPQFNTFQGNVVGLAGDGQTTIANRIGFVLINAVRNTIGGETSLQANTVVGSTEDGVALLDGSRENTILLNYLGVLPPQNLQKIRKTNPSFSPNGSGFGNGGSGIRIANGASNNIFGGATPDSGVVIANSGGNGITLEANAGNGNLFGANSIFANAGFGIDIGNDGPTPNDPADADAGANNLQNYPEIVSRQIVNNELIIEFKVDSASVNSDYGANGINVKFFKADASGEGERFLGEAFYTVADYNNGSPLNKTVNLGDITTLGITENDPLTATATDAGGNTSEFTPALAPTAANVIVAGRVTNDSNGVAKATVILSDSSGNTRRVLTNSFGYFHFEDVAVGQTYVVRISSKRHQFSPHVIFVGEEITDLNFSAEP